MVPLCIPCAGTPIDCNTGTTSTQACDDGDSNTVNDVEIILDCDGSICIPCMGTPCAVEAIIQDLTGSLNCQSLDEGIILDGTLSTSGASIDYQWTFDNTLIGTSNTVDVFAGGIYALEVTDNTTGCSAIAEIEVIIPTTVLEPVYEIVHESCTESEDGGILIDTVLGGREPYLYALNSESFSFEHQFSNLAPGVYDLLIQDADGCELRMEIQIEAAPELILDLGEDQTINIGEPIKLQAITNAVVDTAIWEEEESLSCTDCLEPTANPITQTTYLLTLTDVNGCTVSDQITVFVRKERKVYIPNSFSPNKDGINDQFLIYGGPDIKEVLTFKIFDRWGSAVFSRENFQPNDPQFAWDGTVRGEAMPNDVFVYFAEIEFLDGKVEVFSGEIIILK